MGNKELKFLYLSQEDLIKAGILDMHKCVKAMDEMFKLVGKGDYLMQGPRGDEHSSRIFFPATPTGSHLPKNVPQGRYGAMIGYLGGKFNLCSAKLVGPSILNHFELDRPLSMVTVALMNPVTGDPLAIMEGSLLSAMRTGGVTGISAKYLARKNSEVIGVVGAGRVNRACLMGLADVLRNIKEVRVFNQTRSKSEAFSGEMSKQLQLNVHPVDSLEEAVADCDVITVATSGPNPPLIRTEWLKEGAYIAAVGGTLHLTEDWFLATRKVADLWAQFAAWYRTSDALPVELQGIAENKPYIEIYNLLKAGRLQAEDIDNLGSIAIGERPGRVNDRETIVFLTVGLIMDDIALGYEVYKEAINKGIGQELTLWKQPYWT